MMTAHLSLALYPCSLLLKVYFVISLFCLMLVWSQLPLLLVQAIPVFAYNSRLEISMKSSYQAIHVHLIFALNVKCSNTHNSLPTLYMIVIFAFSLKTRMM